MAIDISLSGSPLEHDSIMKKEPLSNQETEPSIQPIPLSTEKVPEPFSDQETEPSIQAVPSATEMVPELLSIQEAEPSIQRVHVPSATKKIQEPPSDQKTEPSTQLIHVHVQSATGKVPEVLCILQLESSIRPIPSAAKKVQEPFSDQETESTMQVIQSAAEKVPELLSIQETEPSSEAKTLATGKVQESLNDQETGSSIQQRPPATEKVIEPYSHQEAEPPIQPTPSATKKVQEPLRVQETEPSIQQLLEKKIIDYSEATNSVEDDRTTCSTSKRGKIEKSNLWPGFCQRGDANKQMKSWLFILIKLLSLVSGAYGQECVLGKDPGCPSFSPNKINYVPKGSSWILASVPVSNTLDYSVKIDMFRASQTFSCRSVVESLQHNCSVTLWDRNITDCPGFSLERMENKSVIRYSNITQPFFYCAFVQGKNHFHVHQGGVCIEDIPSEITTTTSSKQTTGTTVTTTTLTQGPKSDGKVDKSWKNWGIVAFIIIVPFIIIVLVMCWKRYQKRKQKSRNEDPEAAPEAPEAPADETEVSMLNSTGDQQPETELNNTCPNDQRMERPNGHALVMEEVKETSFPANTFQLQA